MRLLLDTNILISALIKEGIARKIIFHTEIELATINFSEEEINEYKLLIQEKGKINSKELESLLVTIKERLVLVKDELILEKMLEAKEIMWAIDPKDTPFIAAALAIDADIWSDDKHFKKQEKIKVWKTSDVYKLFIEDWEDWVKKMRKKDKKRVEFWKNQKE